MEPGYENNRFEAFCHLNPNGTKLVKQYYLEMTNLPGTESRTVLRRLEKNSKGEMDPGRIVVCMEKFSMPFMSGIKVRHIWAKRNPGPTAKTSTTMSPWSLLSITARLVLFASRRILSPSLPRGAGVRLRQRHMIKLRMHTLTNL